MREMRKKILPVLAVLLAAVAFTGCGEEKNSFATGQYYYPSEEEGAESVPGGEAGQETVTEESTETAEDGAVTADLFLITKNDMQEECIILEQLASGKQYMYYYSVTTQFLDKYGNRAAVSEFTPGRVMTVGKKDVDGRLMQAQLSDAVWEYPDVTRYSVDGEKGIFTIADTNYSYDDNLFIWSDDKTLRLSDLTELDTLDIVGIGRKILSVSVATGHGTLQLRNTELFDGSFIQVGNKIFSEITPDMKLEIPEGVYTVAVANNGYGGSTDIEIKRGQQTELDLDTLKGEGPKTGNILFAVDVADAAVFIDGEEVDYSEPVPVSYGLHTLTVTADSYEPYKKKLFVNSEEATIVVGLSGEDGAAVPKETEETEDADQDAKENETSGSSTQGNGQAGSLAGGLAGSHSSGTSGGSGTGTNINALGEAELDAMVESLLDEDKKDSKTDYLSTLAELLSALTDGKKGTE